jgi:CMP-N,N'-diacetyllegionaminic acid synthase
VTEVLALVPARGGSKRIPGKNLKKFLGRPLIEYTIKAAQAAERVTRIVVTSDDDKILALANQLVPGSGFKRANRLAGDDTPMLPVVQEVVAALEQESNYVPNVVVLLQPTSPARISDDIDQVVNLLIKNRGDSAVSVVDVPHNFVPESLMRERGGFLEFVSNWSEDRNLSQLKPKYLARNGAAVYAVTIECLKYKKSLFGDKIVPYRMNRLRSIDIDDDIDWIIGEFVVREGLHKKSYKK